MKNKLKRLQEIKKIISTTPISRHEELLGILESRGYKLTQATMSRDLKRLKVMRTLTSEGFYKYTLPPQNSDDKTIAFLGNGFLSIVFSGFMAVIKTRPGYASSLAYEIDLRAQNEVLGTVAGEDTIFLVLDEKTSRKAVIKSLSAFIPNIQG